MFKIINFILSKNCSMAIIQNTFVPLTSSMEN